MLNQQHRLTIVAVVPIALKQCPTAIVELRDLGGKLRIELVDNRLTKDVADIGIGTISAIHDDQIGCIGCAEVA